MVARAGRLALTLALRAAPSKGAKLRGLKRKAAVVLGNVRMGDDVGVLTRALDDHDEPLVRKHASWAPFRLGNDDPAAR
jgi:epoxyqueuosine reductase